MIVNYYFCFFFYHVSFFFTYFKMKSYVDCIDESFQDYSWIQDFEADFLWKVSLKMLN